MHTFPTSHVQEEEREALLRARNKRLALVLAAGMLFIHTLSWFYPWFFRVACGAIGIDPKTYEYVGTASTGLPAGAATGLANAPVGGQVSGGSSHAASVIGADRLQKVLVRCMGVSGQLPIDIVPLDRVAWVKIGATNVVRYRLTNLTDRKLDFKAVHDLSPESAAPEFQLIRCFCDVHRVIAPKQSQELEVVFRISSPIPGDAGLTLNYTLFDYDPKSNGTQRTSNS